MPRNAETASFKLNHAMIRIKDPKASLAFYQDVIGMDLLLQKTFGNEFSIYFVAFPQDGPELTPEEKEASAFNREGVLELKHEHGTESDPKFAGYASGNSEPGKGFGHLAITVDDIKKACARFESLGVPFKTKLGEKFIKEIAFIMDPDGYWIEVFPNSLRL